jgi:tetratricopeptide (TPR) repeat protein
MGVHKEEAMKTLDCRPARKAWRPLAAILLVVSAIESSATECAPQRTRSSQLMQYVTQFIVDDYRLAGVVPHASTDVNPRPMPMKSLHDSRSEGQAVLLLGKAERELYQLENLFYFAFLEQGHSNPAPDVISASRDSLWCLVREGDLVLLSDRKTHHSTRVFKVDREAGYIYFVDRWPDVFFLREGLNMMEVAAKAMVPDLGDVRARIETRRFPGVDEKTNTAWNKNELMWLHTSIMLGTKSKEVIQIRREDFLRTVYGLMTIDTAELPSHYLRTNPSAATDPRVSLAFAATLVDAADRYAEPALRLNKRAVALAKEIGDANLERLAAARTAYAATLLELRSVELNDKQSVITAQKELEAIYRSFHAAELMKLWDAGELYRAGRAAGAANRLENSISYFDRALELNPQYEEAYFYRGNARFHQVRPLMVVRDLAGVCAKKRTLEEAIRDLERALSLNQSATTTVQAVRKSRDPRDRYAIAGDEAKQKSLEDRRREETKVHFAAGYLVSQCN